MGVLGDVERLPDPEMGDRDGLMLWKAHHWLTFCPCGDRHLNPFWVRDINREWRRVRGAYLRKTLGGAR